MGVKVEGAKGTRPDTREHFANAFQLEFGISLQRFLLQTGQIPESPEEVTFLRRGGRGVGGRFRASPQTCLSGISRGKGQEF